MKRFLAGLVVGAILSVGGGALAANTLVGRTIQETYPIFINGKRLDHDAIGINGVSYIPTRDATTLFGYEVKWDPVKFEIHLNTPTIDRPEVIRYPVHSSVDLAVNTREEAMTITRDGNLYVYMNMFGKYVTWKKPVVTFAFPGDNLSVQAPEEYVVGADGFIYNGTVYVKASLFPVIISIRDGTLYVEP